MYIPQFSLIKALNDTPSQQPLYHGDRLSYTYVPGGSDVVEAVGGGILELAPPVNGDLSKWTVELFAVLEGTTSGKSTFLSGNKSLLVENQLLFGISRTRFFVYRSTGTNSTVTLYESVVALTEIDEVKVVVVKDNTLYKCYVNDVLVREFIYEFQQISNALVLLGSKKLVSSVAYLGSAFVGKVREIRVSYGVALPPELFYDLPKYKDRTVALSTFLDKPTSLEMFQSDMLKDIKVYGKDIFFIFSDGSYYALIRPVGGADGVVLSSANRLSNGDLQIILSDNTEYVFDAPSVVELGDPRPQGTGYLAVNGSGETVYKPIVPGNGVVLDETENNFILRVTAGASTAINQNKLVHITYDLEASERYVPAYTQNAWNKLDFTVKRNTLADVVSLNKIILPAGEYYVDGELKVMSDLYSKARILALVGSEVICESNVSESNTAIVGFKSLYFKDYVTIAVDTEIQVELLIELNTTETLVSDVIKAITRMSFVKFYKVT